MGIADVTDAELDEWERIAGAATPGPWVQRPTVDHPDYESIGRDMVWRPTTAMNAGSEWFQTRVDEDAAFVVAARDAVPRLIQALRAERAGMHSPETCKHVGHDVTFGKGGPGGRCSTCHEDLTAAQGLRVLYEAERDHRRTT